MNVSLSETEGTVPQTLLVYFLCPLEAGTRTAALMIIRIMMMMVMIRPDKNQLVIM